MDVTQDIDHLFARTLVGDYDDDAPWDAVRSLRRIGSRAVFERAAEWSRSEEPLVRARGLDVLAQLGKTYEHPQNNFPEEGYSVVSELVRHEKDVRPLNSAIFALGHLDDPRAIPLIAGFSAHPESETRFAVACALGSFPNDERSIRALLSLTEDTDDDVRDWATFGLGVLGDADSPEIRDALARRLDDPNKDVREEAMVGLGKRRDKRVVPDLMNALGQPAVSRRVVEAAYILLGMESDREDWSAADYASALRERFQLTV